MSSRTILITGGAGFIGSHVVRLFVNKYPDYRIINLDKLTYAGNLANLKDIEDRPNYRFVKMDICDFEGVLALMREEKVDGVIHLAAESHVDRSIKDPFTFAQTNVIGTLSMLQAAKAYWEPLGYVMPGPDRASVPCRFYHISTDEVYGALEMTHPEGIEPPFTTKASSGEHHLAYGEKFFTEDLKYQRSSSRRTSSTSRTARIALQRRPATISCGRSTTPTECRPSSRIAPTTTARTSSRRSSSRCLSITSATGSPCPCTERARTCATGCT